MEQWVKDSVLSLQQLKWLLWRGFIPWPGNFHVHGTKKKKKKGEKREYTSLRHNCFSSSLQAYKFLEGSQYCIHLYNPSAQDSTRA